MMIPEVMERMTTFPERKSVVLYGAETHICIKQTCFDLLEKGYHVYIVVDGVSSINSSDRNVGMEAMKQAGAHLTTF